MTTALRRQQNSAASCSDLATKATPYSAPEKISDSPTQGSSIDYTPMKKTTL